MEWEWETREMGREMGGRWEGAAREIGERWKRGGRKSEDGWITVKGNYGTVKTFFNRTYVMAATARS